MLLHAALPLCLLPQRLAQPACQMHQLSRGRGCTQCVHVCYSCSQGQRHAQQGNSPSRILSVQQASTSSKHAALTMSGRRRGNETATGVHLPVLARCMSAARASCADHTAVPAAAQGVSLFACNSGSGCQQSGQVKNNWVPCCTCRLGALPLWRRAEWCQLATSPLPAHRSAAQQLEQRQLDAASHEMHARWALQSGLNRCAQGRDTRRSRLSRLALRWVCWAAC